jgi:hypothetical protein
VVTKGVAMRAARCAKHIGALEAQRQ